MSASQHVSGFDKSFSWQEPYILSWLDCRIYKNGQYIVTLMNGSNNLLYKKDIEKHISIYSIV